MVYKYGVSDAKFHALGGMHLLFWKAIQDARSRGCTVLDFGRTEQTNHGLTTFKDRWGTARTEMTYWRYAPSHMSRSSLRRYAVDGFRHVLGHAPEVCRIAAGRFLYRHAG